MNTSLIFSIIFGLLCIVAFYISLLTSSARRIKSITLYLLLIMLFIAVYINLRDKLSNEIFTYCLWVLPTVQIITFIINQQRAVPTFACSEIKFSEFISGLFAGILSFGFAILYSFPNPISIAGDQTYISIETWYSQIGMLVFYILCAVWMLMFAMQKTMFFTEGFIYKSMLYSWSDIKSYSVVPDTKKHSRVQLELNVGEWLFEKTICVHVAAHEKDLIENFLGKLRSDIN